MRIFILFNLQVELFFFTAIIIVLELDMPLQSYLFQVPTQMCMCFCFEHPAQKYYQDDKNYEVDNTKHVDYSG